MKTTELPALPTTYDGAIEMVQALDPDKDSTTHAKYVAYERLKLFFKLIFAD